MVESVGSRAGSREPEVVEISAGCSLAIGCRYRGKVPVLSISAGLERRLPFFGKGTAVTMKYDRGFTTLDDGACMKWFLLASSIPCPSGRYDIANTQHAQ
jgi:hypothetical protein